jgi:eukaryotic-like serine/threonine-protein kinase
VSPVKDTGAQKHSASAHKLGKYEILGRIAEGGMGALFKARHPTLGRIVLLKKLTLGGGGQVVERFKREARLMMDLKSENIVQVYDHFKEGPYYVIVEEYVPGISLDALIRRERYLSTDAATLILYEVCRALQYAHGRQVIHRDIKPGNILLAREGRVKLADFGIATSRGDAEEGLTSAGMILGTPAYLPPEQIDDPRSVDQRADIYSVGVVLYEMITGHTPFPSALTSESVSLIQRGKFTPAQKLNPRSSPFLRAIAARCMKVKPRKRFQDVGQIITLLEKRIRRRDPSEIQAALKSVLSGGDISHIFRRRVSWPARAAVAVLAVCFLGAAAVLTWDQGYWLEIFAAGRVGALVVGTTVDSSDTISLPIGAALYREDTALTRLPDVDFAFHEESSRATTDRRVIESRKLYLPTGRYRLKVETEGGLYWSSFQLDARARQRTRLATSDALHVTVRQDPAGGLPLQVTYTAHAADTGADLSGLAQLQVNLGGKWVTLPDRGVDLTTGQTWRFRIQADGYEPLDYALVVKPAQTVLDIDAQLEPRK